MDISKYERDGKRYIGGGRVCWQSNLDVLGAGMASGFVDSVFDQTFKRHPYLFLFVLVCCGGVLGASYKVFAEEVDVQRRFVQLDSRITRLEHRVDRGFLENQAFSLGSEIYKLERLVADGEAEPRDHERLTRLRFDLSRINRELDSLSGD